MSYILEALKKSEQQRRQQSNAPDLGAIHQAPETADAKTAHWPLALLVMALIFGAGFWGYHIAKPSNPIPAPANREPIAPTVVQPPEALAPNTQALYQDTPAKRDEVTQLYQAPEHAVQAKAEKNPATQESTKLPNIRDLPLTIQSQIGPMDYSAHVYSSDASRGFVIINGKRRYREDQLENGLMLVTVLEDKVVMAFMGQLFTLDAMQSWPAH